MWGRNNVGLELVHVKNEGHISVVQEPIGGQKSVVWVVYYKLKKNASFETV